MAKRNLHRVRVLWNAIKFELHTPFVTVIEIHAPCDLTCRAEGAPWLVPMLGYRYRFARSGGLGEGYY